MRSPLPNTHRRRASASTTFDTPASPTWLNAGIPPAQAAGRAGHNAAIPLKIYAKSIDGQDHINRRRIENTPGHFEAPNDDDPDCKPEGTG